MVKQDDSTPPPPTSTTTSSMAAGDAAAKLLLGTSKVVATWTEEQQPSAATTAATSSAAPGESIPTPPAAGAAAFVANPPPPPPSPRPRPFHLPSRGVVSFRQTDIDRKKQDATTHSLNNNNIKDTSNDGGGTTSTVRTSSKRSALPKQNSAYNHIDLRTGMRTTRWQSVEELDDSSHCEFDHDTLPRRRKFPLVKGFSMRNLLVGGQGGGENENDDDDPNDDDDDDRQGDQQQQQQQQQRHDCRRHYRISSHAAQGVYINNAVNSQKRHDFFSNYLRWTFQATFFAVTLASFVQFMVLILFFAIFIYWIDVYQPECLAMNNPDLYNRTRPHFMDSYQLSWTTLATVGYGVVAPGLPSISNGENCFGISILMAFESFVGVLFCGFISAIMFSKVARVQSIAAITFSDPMLVRYGTGVLMANASSPDEKDIDGDAMSGDFVMDNKIDLPCPILEFRIVNDLWNYEGGEIINASINMVASTDGAHKEFDNMADVNCTAMRNIPDNMVALGKAVASVTGQAIGVVGTKTGQAIGHVGNKTGQAMGVVGSKVTTVGTKTGQAIGTVGQVIGSRTSTAVKSVLLGGGSSHLGIGNSSHHTTLHLSPSSVPLSPSATTDSAITTTSPPSSLLRNGTGGSGIRGKAFSTPPPTIPAPSLFGNSAGRSYSDGGSFIQKVHNTFTKPSPADAHPGFAQAAAAENGSGGGGTAPYNQNQLMEEQINKELERRLEHLASTGQLGNVLHACSSDGGAVAGGGVGILHGHSAHHVWRQSVAVEEGDAQLVPPRIYHKLDVETDTHPFFRRVWIIRHVLNESSPLVSIEAQRRIKENNGHWPEEYNNWQSVREHVNFMEIIVSLSGTMNVSGSTVYGLKVYDYVDMNIGYTFATLFTKDATGKMIVDKVLLNDVRAQAGGGEEPLQAQNDKDINNELLAIAEKTFAVTAQAATAAADKTTEIVQGAAEKTGQLAKGAADKGMEFVKLTKTDIYS